MSTRREGLAGAGFRAQGSGLAGSVTVNMAPPPGRFCGAHLASVELDQVLHNRQPQTGAARIARPRLVHAIEALEHAGQILVRNPRTLRLTPRSSIRPSARTASIRIAGLLGTVGDRRSRRGCAARREAWPDRRGRFRRRRRPRSRPAADDRRQAAPDRRPPPARASASRSPTMSSVSCPASSRASRSRSLTSRSIRSVWRMMIARNRRLSSGSASPSDSASTYPRIAVSGVRSSCDTFATKSRRI